MEEALKVTTNSYNSHDQLALLQSEQTKNVEFAHSSKCAKIQNASEVRKLDSKKA